jgi:hypothetical protein
MDLNEITPMWMKGFIIRVMVWIRDLYALVVIRHCPETICVLAVVITAMFFILLFRILSPR